MKGKKKKRTKDKSIGTEHGNIYVPKQLWSSPTLLTQMALFMKERSVLKYEIQKEHIETPQNRNYWHFPLCNVRSEFYDTLLRLQYTLQICKAAHV